MNVLLSCTFGGWVTYYPGVSECLVQMTSLWSTSDITRHYHHREGVYYVPSKCFKLSEDLQVERNGRYNKIGSFHTQDKTVSRSFLCWSLVLFCAVAPVLWFLWLGRDNLHLKIKVGVHVYEGNGKEQVSLCRQRVKDGMWLQCKGYRLRAQIWNVTKYGKRVIEDNVQVMGQKAGVSLAVIETEVSLAVTETGMSLAVCRWRVRKQRCHYQ